MSCDYESPQWVNRDLRRSRKVRRCCECCAWIYPGDTYESTVGKWWDGDVSTFETCHRCVDLRNWALAHNKCLCWSHGGLHDDIKAFVSEVVEREKIPGFWFEWGRKMIEIKRAAAEAKRG